MIFGNNQEFAIEVEISEVVDGWVLGHFRFWARGMPIGDWQDTTDLRGCARWMREFMNEWVERYDPALEDKSAEEVMRRLFDEIMPISGGQPSRGGKAADPKSTLRSAEAVRRFHIAHLGMSSFDRVDLLLVELADRRQRLIWRDTSDLQVHEALLNPDEIQKTSGCFCEWFDQEMKAR